MPVDQPSRCSWSAAWSMVILTPLPLQQPVQGITSRQATMSQKQRMADSAPGFTLLPRPAPTTCTGSGTQGSNVHGRWHGTPCSHQWEGFPGSPLRKARLNGPIGSPLTVGWQSIAPGPGKRKRQGSLVSVHFSQREPRPGGATDFTARTRMGLSA